MTHQRYPLLEEEFVRNPHLSAEIQEIFKEVRGLRQWKAEALALLGLWDLVYEAAGKPGRIGDSIPAVVRAQVAEDRAIASRVRLLVVADDEDPGWISRDGGKTYTQTGGLVEWLLEGAE